MAIANVHDAQEVEQSLQSILTAPDTNGRVQAIRSLFVEVLDYDYSDQRVSLGSAGNSQLPEEAHIVARRDGVSAVYVPLGAADSNRVTGAAASAAAKTIGNALADDSLLLFTNRDGDQLHIIKPDLTGSRPRLQRIVAHRDQRQRTVIERIANMWDDYGNRGKTIGEAIANAFSVEPVTKLFFETYRKVFEEAKASIGGFGDGEADQEDKHLFTQTLFNRLMFVYFLSRKGWLKFNDDTDYLNALWHDRESMSKHGSFYDTRLRPLFFSGLNNPKSMDLTRGLATLIGEVPFLNGGLFEETDLDWRDGVTVPDETIEQILGSLFDRFNFTVMESTPFDVEVAVDPEMLGKVFEELVTGRHDSGAYYTPREVVSFMCREALKGYLENRDTGLVAEAIASFVDHYDTSGLNVSAARRISEALNDVKVVDPACGSGAYLLGMMQELIELQTALYNAGADAKALYELKLDIIHRNLYGVDIDEFAMNIAMLRLWLSLAIEYDGEKPEPLPNLDFKVVCGDSLLGPNPSTGKDIQGTLGRDVAKIQRLGRLKANFLRAYLGSDKDRLKAEIEKLSGEISKELGVAGTAEDVVDWRVEFAEVFAEHQGFDIAIANPPYVQLQRNGGELGRLYMDSGYEVFVRTGDLYFLFYERGINLLKETGYLCFISSNQWMKVDSAKNLRLFLEHQDPVKLVNLGSGVFDTATVNTSVLIVKRSPNINELLGADVRSETEPFPPEEWVHIRPSQGETWIVLPAVEQRIKGKIDAAGTRLKDWGLNIKYGVKTGYDKAFIVDDATKNLLISNDGKSSELMKPVLRGRDIQRYQAMWAGFWLIDTHNGYGNVPGVNIEGYPAIRSHLSSSYARLEKRQDKGSTPYNLRNCAYYGEFLKEKIVWGNLNKRARFAYGVGGTFVNAPTSILTPYSPYLLAVLNSTLLDWYFRLIGVERDGGYYEYKPMFIERLPVPKIATEEQQPFVKLVDRILKSKNANPDADTTALELEIDRLVYDLYGLTDEEITTIERSLDLIHANDEEEDAALLRAMMEVSTSDPGDFVSEDAIMATLRELDGG